MSFIKEIGADSNVDDAEGHGYRGPDDRFDDTEDDCEGHMPRLSGGRLATVVGRATLVATAVFAIVGANASAAGNETTHGTTIEAAETPMSSGRWSGSVDSRVVAPELAINLPGGFYCSGGRVLISPPRIWATYGTTPVQWAIVIQRYNSSTRQWYTYTGFTSYSSFNIYGQSVTSWSGGRFVNSYMQIPVYQTGYYRVATSVAAVDGYRSGWVSGGNYCTIY